jgi:Icc-related predicted phosphoesterase
MKLRIVAFSDTHAHHRSVDIPDGDILIHAGDITRSGDPEEVKDFNDFLGELPHPHKVVIAGNHDFCFERDPEATEPLLTNCVYLMDGGVRLEGLNIYGSPWQPWFFDWAFNLQRGAEIKEKWDMIPDDVDILVTHGPPYHVLDETRRGKAVGCRDLLDAIARVRPKVHIFGHIHEGYGRFDDGRTVFINASSCDFSYNPANPAIVEEVEI